MKKTLIVAALLALTMTTGCGKIPEENNVQIIAVEKRDIQPEVIQSEALTKSGNKKQTEIKQDADKGNKASGMMAGELMEDPELIQTAADALKKYFNVTYDSAVYQTSISYFEGYKDLKPNYSISISWPENWEITLNPENIGADGYPTEEALKKMKPEYYAIFSETKELTGLYVNYMGWEKIKAPLSLEGIKTVAKEFLVSNDLITDGQIKFMGSNVMTKNRVIVTYQNGKKGAVNVSVDPTTGKADHFEYMSKERAETLLGRKAESKQLG